MEKSHMPLDFIENSCGTLQWTARDKKMEKENRKPFNFRTCDMCHYGSRSEFIMQKHLSRYPRWFDCKSNTPEMHECELCGFKTDLKVILTEHFQASHCGKQVDGVPLRILECFRCKKCFKTYSLLVFLKHERSNFHGDFPAVEVKSRFKCDECSYEAAKNFMLTRHKINKHLPPEEINWHHCDKCPYKAKLKTALKIHIMCKHSKCNETQDVNRYECDKCPYKCNSKSRLNLHFLDQHVDAKDVKWHKCKQCTNTFRVWNDLRKHVQLVHENMWYECDKCSYKTKVKTHLKSHTMYKHLSPEEIHWFKCDKCPYKAKRKFDLHIHVLRMHSE